MPSRRQSKWNRPARPLATETGERAESWRGTAYRVRPVAGTGGGPYRCPGCDQLLPAGVGHVVAWPADDLDATDRRHWHTACWQARDRRAPGIERSRNAPRYG
ncbi:ATP/GTP-binding protein [Jatrophihabitans sp.]|uniref:ATP/GTP-binding protein n=1 Tax=Jatrophihabitans sp. TaxID=1932789 RepID=UPI002CF9AFA2|nr:hypothetical protein [Jatrophihabitans sp.]